MDVDLVSESCSHEQDLAFKDVIGMPDLKTPIFGSHDVKREKEGEKAQVITRCCRDWTTGRDPKL
jgi:hypothetical protein